MTDDHEEQQLGSLPTSYGALAGPGEDPEEPPEEYAGPSGVGCFSPADRDAELDEAGRRIAERIPPVNPALHEREPDDAPWRPMIATDEHPNGRPIDAQALADRIAWGSTVEFMLSVGQATEERLTDLDRRCLSDYRIARGTPADDYARAPLGPVDVEAAQLAEAVYLAHLVEPYGDVVPAWENLSDPTRELYVRRAARVRELLGTRAADGTPEPQRVVVGFGSPAVAADVLATLRRWRDEASTDDVDEIAALIERVEEQQ